ncbi:MAG: T9SS type A sorting domain-containing protein [Candidatus Cloacimonetes bacterium]|nr:T9SS type A sorting domain-containing protein [Candidatus Cloacimonadota bacterium]
MKKVFVVTMILLLALNILHAKDMFSYSSKGNSIEIQFENTIDMTAAEDNVFTTIAVPSDDIEIVIHTCVLSEYDDAGNLLKTVDQIDEKRILKTNSFTMRDLSAHTLQIKTNVYNEKHNTYSKIEKMEFEIVPTNDRQVPKSLSKAFYKVYPSVVDNFDESYLEGLQLQPSNMLIICHQLLENYIQNFIDWKEAKGIECSVATLTETGTTANEIKAYIQQVYDTSDVPPDYVLLIGDVDDYFAVPSFYFSAENDVSDHPYTLLDGTDYFPDVIIGRMSIDEINQLWTVINKVISYEKTPYLENPEWLKKALVVAGNYSTTPPTPSTPVKVSRWLRDKMLHYGFTQVDTVFYPPTYPGTSEIVSKINAGISFLNYRGWGDANGWHYPEFHVDNMGSLSNGVKTPVVTSFVCNTGDFANTSADPCFGEAILQLGTPTAPQGGVVFVGPSDLHTSTKLNNSLFSGFYYGLLDEGIYDFGLSVLRGKIELYHNFPLQQGLGDQVEFYFYVYNILGDPTLTMWTTIPEEIQCTIPETVTVGTNYLDVTCTNLEEGTVTAKKADEFYEVAFLENGHATIPFTSESTGEIILVITAPNFIAKIDTIDVLEQTNDVGLFEYETSAAVQAGSTLSFDLTLKNFGTSTASGVSATLSSSSSFITIPVSTKTFGDITSGGTSVQSYEIEIHADCPDIEVLEFVLDISTGSTSKFSLIASSLLFEVVDVNVNSTSGWLEPGQINQIQVTIQNIASFNAVGIDGELAVYSDAAELTSTDYAFGSVNMNATSSGTFNVKIESNCFIGRNIPFELTLTDAENRITQTYFSLETGPIETNAPTGPDAFGYYAYDSYDVDYSEVPIYFWEEIDPQEGGFGDVIFMADDESRTIPLPFSFTYYGEIFDEITICSNGWISFITNDWTNFRNWDIPSALGPYGQVCAYWDDLIGEPYTVSDTTYHHDMRICHYNDLTNNRFIIEWNECCNRFDDTSVEKFQLVLYDPVHYPTASGNGELQCNYHTISNPDATSNYSTLGIENLTQSDGVLYTYADIYPASATPLENELAIKYTTDPPDPYYAIDDEPVMMNGDLGIYPQPSSGSTMISYYTTDKQLHEVTAGIFNIKGQLVRSLELGSTDFGFQTVWNGLDDQNRKTPNGIYFVKIDNAKYTDIGKILLLR